MKKISRFLAGAALLLSPLAANAADMTVPMKAPVPAVAAVYDWTGFYLGINGGYGWGSQDPLTVLSNRFDRTSFNMTGGVFGGTVGAQIQKGHVVLGVEGDIDWANISGSRITTPMIAGQAIPITVNIANKTDAVATARMRFGGAFDNLLVYGTAGAAFLHETAAGTSVAGNPCGTAGVLTNCSGSIWRPGLAAGLGAEYAFAHNWTVKGEYLYIVGVGTGVSVDRVNLFRTGVNIKF
jgi:outer membrane immunogenic protein